jgi:hypothetical protein
MEECNQQGVDIECKQRNSSLCGPEYSDFENIVFCQNPVPALFPPTYAIHLEKDLKDDQTTSDIFNLTDIPPETTAMYLWTGGTNEAFTTQTMDRYLRQPNLTSALSNPQVLQGIQVC